MAELDEQADRRAWLALLKTDYRRLGVDTRYDDEAASRYSWDSRVANFRQIRRGDLIAVWDERELLGMSVIESIEEGYGTKQIARCRNCRTTNIERRTTMIPTYRCSGCEDKFEEPAYEEVKVATYRSSHGQAWTELTGTLAAEELRALCVKPRSQNSFRELRWDDFLAAVRKIEVGNPLAPVEATSAQISGGHSIKPVRVRLGQSSFRAALLRKYRSTCAFSGPLPEASLEACHLYSYAEVGQHHDDGGILLRRDLHRLFDRGLIAVDASDIIDVSADIRHYPIYDELHGQRFKIESTPAMREWLRLHWEEFRT